MEIVALIAKVGIPAAIDIIKVLREKGQPTLEDWEKELTRINKTYESYISDAEKKLAR